GHVKCVLFYAATLFLRSPAAPRQQALFCVSTLKNLGLQQQPLTFRCSTAFFRRVHACACFHHTFAVCLGFITRFFEFGLMPGEFLHQRLDFAFARLQLFFHNPRLVFAVMNATSYLSVTRSCCHRKLHFY